MKRALWLFAPVLVLGMISGAALVVACGGSTRADAQTGAGATRVVDATGATLGTFLGAATGWAPGPGGTGTVPSGEIFSFLDSAGRIWHVAAGGTIRQPESDAYYSGAGCTGTVYVQLAAGQGVARAAGSYWTIQEATSTITPASSVPLGGTTAACADWAGGQMAVHAAAPVAAPTFTAPLRIQ
jgi:hypothetical protein